MAIKTPTEPTFSNGKRSYRHRQGQPAAVPEPSSLVLLGATLLLTRTRARLSVSRYGRLRSGLQQFQRSSCQRRNAGTDGVGWIGIELWRME